MNWAKMKFKSFWPTTFLKSPALWTWTWANLGRWWGTERPEGLQSMGSQRVGHDWVAEQQHFSKTRVMIYTKKLHVKGIIKTACYFPSGSVVKDPPAQPETWVWVNSGSWWGTGRPGMLQSMGSQRVGQDWVTELNWWELLGFPGGKESPDSAGDARETEKL